MLMWQPESWLHLDGGRRERMAFRRPRRQGLKGCVHALGAGAAMFATCALMLRLLFEGL